MVILKDSKLVHILAMSSAEHKHIFNVYKDQKNTSFRIFETKRIYAGQAFTL